MANDSSRFSKWFDLILAMTDGNYHTAAELAAVMGTSRRNFYYVLRALESLGLLVKHESTHYYIDPRSPFLNRLCHSVELTSDEADFL